MEKSLNFVCTSNKSYEDKRGIHMWTGQYTKDMRKMSI